MQIRILTIGRAGKTPEAELCSDYLARSEKSGRRFGVRDISIQELDERKLDSREAGSRALIEALNGEPFWLLDERGKVQTSPEFSENLARQRDDGQSRINFVIGGADGVTDELRELSSNKLSFGKMVWPHMLARVMLTEQIYRAISIWGNSPYHRY